MLRKHVFKGSILIIFVGSIATYAPETLQSAIYRTTKAFVTLILTFWDLKNEVNQMIQRFAGTMRK